jgi:hypothetical protein
VVIHQTITFIGYAVLPRQTHTGIDLAQCAFCAVERFSRKASTDTGNENVGRNGFAEVEWIGECILSEGGQGCPSELQRKETTMSPLRARMIEDMTLAGLAEGTQRVYVQAVRGVTAHYRRSPDLLSEEEVRGYLLGLRQRGVARGTFQTSRYGLRFFYHHTLDRAWALFGGKKDRLATTEAAA